MAGKAAVGIHDNLAAGHPAIALGTADGEFPGRIHQDADVPAIPRAQGERQEFIFDILPYLRLCYVRRVLGGHHHIRDVYRLPLFILDAHLRLGIRPEPGRMAGFSRRRQAPRDGMSQSNGQWQ